MASSRISRWPSAVDMSTVTDRLLRLQAAKYTALSEGLPCASGKKGGPQWRVSSPSPGFSILITSAPMSARFWVHQGPASTRERSSTRRWPSAPAVWVAVLWMGLGEGVAVWFMG